MDRISERAATKKYIYKEGERMNVKYICAIVVLIVVAVGIIGVFMTLTEGPEYYENTSIRRILSSDSIHNIIYLILGTGAICSVIGIVYSCYRWWGERMNNLTFNIVVLSLLCCPFVVVFLLFLSPLHAVCFVISITITIYPFVKNDIKDPFRHRDKNLFGYIVACFKEI